MKIPAPNRSIDFEFQSGEDSQSKLSYTIGGLSPPHGETNPYKGLCTILHMRRMHNARWLA